MQVFKNKISDLFSFFHYLDVKQHTMHVYVCSFHLPGIVLKSIVKFFVVVFLCFVIVYYVLNIFRGWLCFKNVQFLIHSLFCTHFSTRFAFTSFDMITFLKTTWTFLLTVLSIVWISTRGNAILAIETIITK